MIRCKDCKWQERTKYKGDSVCLNSVNEGISPDLQAVILAPDDFGCTHAERRDGLKECCATCRSHMGDMCEKGHWSECNDKDFFKWMDEKVMKCDDYKSKWNI